MPPYNKSDAENEWKAIPDKLKAGLTGQASRDFCALECLANDPLYAKPDSQKIFLLWEAKNVVTVKDEKENNIDGVKIETIEGAQQKHRWLYSLFIPRGKFVRFPFNIWDTEYGDSLSWYTIHRDLCAQDFDKRLLQLPRWSTASRSCLALIPEDVSFLSSIASDKWDTKERFELSGVDGNPKPNVPEWKACKEKRFWMVVGDPGVASESGIYIKGDKGIFNKYRLYSLKTGVNYVGSEDESGAGKNRLEANCSLVMLRSEVIESLKNTDETFGVQTEVLTITAPMVRYDDDGPISDGRDGFQVRNLSCMRPGLWWMPGQAIPYARAAFDNEASPTKDEKAEMKEKAAENQCKFWRKAFAVPLGRAKARLFLNYGLVHTSANAQNFLLGFAKHNKPTLQQFVARDIGDTSWHDDYLNKYVKDVAYGVKVFRAFDKEKNSDIRHILRETTSKAYPPPRMVRLAAYSVLTHDFAKTLRDNHYWTDAQVYDFATGILDGFREFIQEALGLEQLNPKKSVELVDSSIKEYGVDGKYPTGMEQPKLEAYRTLVDKLLQENAVDLLAKADRVRQRGKEAATKNCLNEFKEGSDDGICTLINAEEILLCAGLEVQLGIKKEESCVADKVRDLFSGQRQWPKIVEGPK